MCFKYRRRMPCWRITNLALSTCAVIFTFCSVVFTIYSLLHVPKPEVRSGVEYRFGLPGRRQGVSTNVVNSTLGFEKILVINMLDRTDRRRDMSKAGGVGGLLLRIVEENINTALILEDDVDWDVRLKSSMQAFALASRAFTQPMRHRPWATLADEYIPLPVVGEGDVFDFPPNPKRRMFEVGQVTVPIDRLPETDEPTVSPYGDGWDVLWLGHCGSNFMELDPVPEKELQSPALHSRLPQISVLRVAVPNDYSVPSPEHLRPRPASDLDELSTLHPPHTRVIHLSNGTLCNHAYAVSRLGAERLLNFGLANFTSGGWGQMMQDWCDGLHTTEDDDINIGALWNSSLSARLHPLCVTTQPPLFSQVYPSKGRGKGAVYGGHGAESRGTMSSTHEVDSPYIRYSVRHNAQRIAREKGLTEMEDQWPDD